MTLFLITHLLGETEIIKQIFLICDKCYKNIYMKNTNVRVIFRWDNINTGQQEGEREAITQKSEERVFHADWEFKGMMVRKTIVFKIQQRGWWSGSRGKEETRSEKQAGARLHRDSESMARNFRDGKPKSNFNQGRSVISFGSRSFYMETGLQEIRRIN